MDQEFFDEITESFTQKAPFCQLLGMKVTALDDSSAEMAFSMDTTLIGNPLTEILHGGVSAAALDSVGGLLAIYAVIQQYDTKEMRKACLEHLSRVSTISLTMNYINPGKGQQFFARAQKIHQGKRIYHSNMSLVNEKDIVIAHASGVFSIS